MKKWEKELARAYKKMYAPPKPEEKHSFLKQFPVPRISMWQFMLDQLPYISKWVWGLSAVFFAGMLYFCRAASKESLWILSAMIPYLALLLLVESAKSGGCGMEELEIATRFSLKNLLLARIGIIGVVYFVAFLLIGVFFWRNPDLFPERLPYLFVPFFLTTALGFAFFRHFRGQGNLYAAAGIPVLVSFTYGFAEYAMQFLFLERLRVFWWLGLVALIIISLWEMTIFINQTEDRKWNYS